jgi:predicted dehydrogenase
MTPLRFLIVGPGGMGAGHVAALQTLPEATIVGVCDVNPEVRKTFTDQGLPAFDKWDDLYASVEADCAIINLPHYLYPEAVIAALERGLHVLKEKPFARTLADAERMAAAAQVSGRLLMIAGQTKFLPAFQKAHELIETGALGDIFLARYSIIYDWRSARENRWSWRGRQALSGGVAIIDSGYHPLDQMQWFRGLPEAVYAVTGKMKAAPGTDYDVDDKAVVTLEYPDGGIGVVTICFVAEPSENHLLLHGTKASLDVEGACATLLPHEGAPEQMSFADVDALAAEQREFIQAVRGNRAPLGAPDHALQVQRVIEAAYQSAATGTRIIL